MVEPLDGSAPTRRVETLGKRFVMLSAVIVLVVEDILRRLPDSLSWKACGIVVDTPSLCVSRSKECVNPKRWKRLSCGQLRKEQSVWSGATQIPKSGEGASPSPPDHHMQVHCLDTRTQPALNRAEGQEKVLCLRTVFAAPRASQRV